ncbi:MAG: hypothetical protein ACJ8M1_13520, partial [Chthoniobacterales bacterium]
MTNIFDSCLTTRPALNRRVRRTLTAALGIQLAVCSMATAQNVESISEREIARRQAALPRG